MLLVAPGSYPSFHFPLFTFNNHYKEDNMDKNIIDNDELSVTAATPNGQAALARFGEMIREGRSTAAIEAFARQLPDHPVQGVSLRWLIGQSVWSMLFFGRDDLESLKNFHHYLNKGVYTQAVNRRKERHAVDTGDWGRLVRHPKRQSAWEPLQTVVFSPAQLRIDSLFLDGTALPEILRVCVGLRKADRAAVFAHSPWVYQFFEPKFLNGCEPSRLRFLRRRLNDMPLPVASACLGMIMDEAGDARDDIRELFESALFRRDSMFADMVVKYSHDLRTLRTIARTLGDAIWYFRLAHRVPSFDWVMNETPEDYELSDDDVMIPFRHGKEGEASWDWILAMHRKFKCNVRDIATDILRLGNPQSLAQLPNLRGGKKARRMLLRYALLAVVFFPEQSACAVLRGIEKRHPGLLDSFSDSLGHGLAWYARLHGKLKAVCRKAWGAIPGAEDGDTLEALLRKIA